VVRIGAAGTSAPDSARDGATNVANASARATPKHDLV
jgi:hypothetical protein